MTDLFTCNLSSVSFQALEEFLGLSQAQEKRLPESSHIFFLLYALDLSSTLPWCVAQMATFSLSESKRGTIHHTSTSRGRAFGFLFGSMTGTSKRR